MNALSKAVPKPKAEEGVYGRMPDPFLKVVVSRVELPPVPSLLAICAGYESGAWRSDALAEHLLEWLPEFALNERELRELDGTNARRILRQAARNLYTSEKYQKRGEVGEILLHAADAVRDVVAELVTHTRGPYLRAEFAAIWRKLDPASPHREALRPLLESENKSLDEIFCRLCIPVLLTYDSATLAAHKRADEAYATAIATEIEQHHARFKAAKLPEEVKIVLILVPMSTKADLLRCFDAKLKGQAQ